MPLPQGDKLYKHSCLEWDGLMIELGCPEFEACMCFDGIRQLPYPEHKCPDCDSSIYGYHGVALVCCNAKCNYVLASG